MLFVWKPTIQVQVRKNSGTVIHRFIFEYRNKLQQEQLDIVASRAAEALGEGKVVRTESTYVDFEKTADAFQRVNEYQETGKKKY